MLEGLTRFIIDDGLHYDIEMMKYAMYLKSVSDNPKVGLEHKKNIEKKLMNVEISLNSDGFRNKNDLNKNSKKILMLGDSMTFGWGSQFPFSYHLDNKLKDYESKDLWITFKDSHANDKAHLIIADFLFGEINTFLFN